MAQLHATRTSCVVPAQGAGDETQPTGKPTPRLVNLGSSLASFCIAPFSSADLRSRRLRNEPRHEFDRSYLDRLSSGDPETEAHFTRYFRELLVIKLRSRLRSSALVEDAIQETFLRVLRAVRQPGGIQSPGGFGSFVNSVCNNVLFELYRSHSRVDPLGDDTGAQIRDPHASVEESVVVDEERASVRKVLATLPPKEKQLLEWLFFEERDKDEICRSLGIDRNYLRVLVHRAKQRFKAEYVGS
jgi:RNA polymerase sigma-70 factor (ECF subfamily)